ncbi:unnamed protein product [Bemisia tabaci]|uniref:GST N-terminal domain-containing protein n=1 Tax=Bemisia tabaci TaxID=7038 RepID=A0A9P0AL22_BEMTA|nr:unnamed protein product [Bemisia tabaci]
MLSLTKQFLRSQIQVPPSAAFSTEVKRHITLYQHPISPPCRAVIMAAKLIGVDLELKLVQIKDCKTQEFLKINPLKRIPVLDDGGFLLSERQLELILQSIPTYTAGPTEARKWFQITRKSTAKESSKSKKNSVLGKTSFDLKSDKNEGLEEREAGAIETLDVSRWLKGMRFLVGAGHLQLSALYSTEVRGRITLYQHPRSVASRAVLMTAKLIGIHQNLDLVEISDMKTPEFQKINPFKRIPVLDDNGFLLSESRAINAYLCNEYAKDDSLYPRNSQGRAIVDQMLDFDLGMLNHPIMDYWVRDDVLSKCVCDDVTTVEEIKRLPSEIRLKTVVINNFAYVDLKGSNCEYDNVAFLTDLRALLEADVEGPPVDKVAELLTDLELLHEDMEMAPLQFSKPVNENEKCSVAYIAGSVLKRYLRKIKCNSCNEILITKDLTPDHEWIKHKEYNKEKPSLIYPTKIVIETVGEALFFVEAFLNKKPYIRNMMKIIVTELGNMLDFSWVSGGCPNKVHQEYIIKFLCEGAFFVNVKWWCRRKNRQFIDEARAQKAKKAEAVGEMSTKMKYHCILKNNPHDEVRYQKMFNPLKKFNEVLDRYDFAAGRTFTIADVSLLASVSSVDALGIGLAKYPHILRWFNQSREIIPDYNQINHTGILQIKELVGQWKGSFGFEFS